MHIADVRREGTRRAPKYTLPPENQPGTAPRRVSGVFCQAPTRGSTYFSSRTWTWSGPWKQHEAAALLAGRVRMFTPMLCETYGAMPVTPIAEYYLNECFDGKYSD
jgi:hypothetical protein